MHDSSTKNITQVCVSAVIVKVKERVPNPIFSSSVSTKVNLICQDLSELWFSWFFNCNRVPREWHYYSIVVEKPVTWTKEVGIHWNVPRQGNFRECYLCLRLMLIHMEWCWTLLLAMQCWDRSFGKASVLHNSTYHLDNELHRLVDLLWNYLEETCLSHQHFLTA